MKKRGLDILGITFGIIAFLMVLFSAAMLIGRRPFSFVREFKTNIRILGSTPWSGREEATGEQRVEGDYSEVVIKNLAGNISVDGWDQDHYLLGFKKTGPSEEYLNNLLVGIQTDNDTLTITREYDGPGPSHRGSIAYTLKIPVDKVKELEVNSISGNILCSGMTSSIEQDLHTTSGRIETDNSADLDAKTISGSIVFVFNGKDLDIKTTSGRIEGEISSIDERGSIELRSVSGSVRIAVPDDFSGKLDLRSVSGSVSTEFPIESFTTKKNSLEGTIGGGRIPVDINTTSGSIRIRKLSDVDE